MYYNSFNLFRNNLFNNTLNQIQHKHQVQIQLTNLLCYDHVTNESSSLAFYPCELGYIVRIRGLKAHKIKKQGRENKVCWTVPDLLFLLLVCRSCSLNHFKEGFRDMSLRIIPLLFRNSLIHNLQKNSCEFIFRWCCYSLAQTLLRSIKGFH